jgi:hypothetical protein
MEWLIASLTALLDEAQAKPTGAFKEFLDDRALGLATMLAEGRREISQAADAAAESMAEDAETFNALIEEINALNHEVMQLTARNIVLGETVERLETQHASDRQHIKDLIAEMVRRDVRGG